MPDARHGWRKKCKRHKCFSIGERSHKVLSYQRVTHADNIRSQRRGKNWDRKHLQTYEKSRSQYRNSCSWQKFIHKYVNPWGVWIRESKWHLACCKIHEISSEKVSSGPSYLEGKTWSFELEDKAEPMSTHSHWAIRNWEENPRKLTPLLLNIVEHYKYNQQSCHVSSRCKKDPNYEISRKVITDPKAEKLLLSVIKCLLFSNILMVTDYVRIHIL